MRASASSGTPGTLPKRMTLIKDAQIVCCPLDKTGPSRYTLCQKVRFRAGCDSPLAVKSATTRKGADPVQLRDQRYSPDARNGRQRLCLRALLQFLLQQGAFLFVLPVPSSMRKGLSNQFFERGEPRGRTKPMRKNTTHNLTVAAMLSAVAFILMFIEFPIPMLIPSFVKMDFSDLPALLGAFALGPVYGVVISFMKNLLHIVIKGTSTACVGELCNFMLGAVFSAVAGFIYKHRKSRKTAILGAIAGAAAMAVFSVPSNYFITYPAYVEFYHMPLEAILGMYQAILPSANSLIKCLVIFNMPFTLVKGLLDAVLCLLIYKPLSPILHGRK